MKILIVGGTGTVGRAVVDDLDDEHEIICIGRNPNNDGIAVDIVDSASIEHMFAQIGKIDAIISTLGKVAFKTLDELNEHDMVDSISNKLMGQINLVLIGKSFLNNGGSFTLTSGILSDNFILSGICASTINCAINGFVRASSPELIKHNLRINAVSPTILEESYDAFYPYFSGFYPVSSKKVAFAYRRSVMGIETGKIFDVI